MKVLITGANGFVGAHLARRLSERKDDVRCLVRAGSDAASLADLDVQVVRGDVCEPSSLPAAVEGVDVVFHLAGVRRAPSREDFMRVNAEGTRRVCEAMAAHGARRLVLASSLAASGPATEDRPRREEDPLQPSEWYGESKAEAERIAFAFRDRLEVTSLRPVRIIGPWDRENLPFFRIVRRGLKLKLGGPRRAVSFIDVDDVVDHALLLAEHPKAVGEAFFSTAEVLSLTELQGVVAEVYGGKQRTIPVAPAVLTALAQAADVASKLTGRHLPLNRKLARQLLAPGWVCSGEKSARVLGFRPKVAIRDSVRRCAEWYVEKGWV